MVLKKSQKTLLYEGVTLEADESSGDKKSNLIKPDDKPLVRVSYHDAAVVSKSMVPKGQSVEDRDLFLQFEPIKQALKNKTDKKFFIRQGDPESALKFFIMGKVSGFDPQLGENIKKAIEADHKLKETFDCFFSSNLKKDRKIILKKAEAFFSGHAVKPPDISQRT